MADTLHALIFACEQLALGGTTIEEDLAEFRALDQALLDITQARQYGGTPKTF